METNKLGLKKIYVDMNTDILGTLKAKEGEVNSRGLQVHLVDRGRSIDTSEYKLVFYGRIPNGEVYQRVATEVAPQNGIYEIVYPSNLMTPGTIQVELKLMKEDVIISTNTFELNVDETIVGENVIEGLDELSILEQLLQVASNEDDRIEQFELVNYMLENGKFDGEDGLDGQPGKDGQDGPQGQPGKDGKDGYTPVKDIDYFDGEDGLDGKDGKDGEPGPKGQPGQPGQDGQDGADGADGYTPVKGVDYFDGEDGQDGKSAYQIWLDEGNEGSEQDFLESLKGEDGGYGGVGKSAYEIWLDSGNIGTEEDFLNPLKISSGGSISSNDNISRVMTEHNKQVNVSLMSSASGVRSQVNASEGNVAHRLQYSSATGKNSQVNASHYSRATGPNSQVNASRGMSGYNNDPSAASGNMSQVNSSFASRSTATASQVNSSARVVNSNPYSTAYGYKAKGYASKSNIKIHLLSESGDINHSGVLNSGHNFTDFAELFPNLVGEAQGYGLIQTIDGHGVRPANSGDQAVGVTSATAGVILGETPFSWVDRWLKDEWGAFIYHDILDEDWEPNEDKGETEEDRPTITVPKENPEYDPEREYAKRQDRPDEWSVVGLVGQVYVRLDENVEPMDYVKPLKDGVGQTSSEPTNIRVMKITQDFDKDKGYKIGFCLLK